MCVCVRLKIVYLLCESASLSWRTSFAYLGVSMPFSDTPQNQIGCPQIPNTPLLGGSPHFSNKWLNVVNSHNYKPYNIYICMYTCVYIYIMYIYMYLQYMYIYIYTYYGIVNMCVYIYIYIIGRKTHSGDFLIRVTSRTILWPQGSFSQMSAGVLDSVGALKESR